MEEAQRFIQLKETVDQLSDKKIRLEERFKNEKEKLEKLLKEITEKGYDPQKLSETRKEKEGELKKAVDDLEEKIRKTAEKLNAIEV